MIIGNERRWRGCVSVFAITELFLLQLTKARSIDRIQRS
jgi:hypothetical protein